MFAAKINNIKEFMNCLLKKEAFDVLCVREAEITTFLSFRIKGILNKEFFGDEAPNRAYCLWSEVKPFAFNMIKGSKLPRYIKIVFSADEDVLNAISEKASALFMNIVFENNEVTLITGCSLKVFSLDKSVEYKWDEYVKGFLKANGLAFVEEEY